MFELLILLLVSPKGVHVSDYNGDQVYFDHINKPVQCEVLDQRNRLDCRGLKLERASGGWYQANEKDILKKFKKGLEKK